MNTEEHDEIALDDITIDDVITDQPDAITDGVDLPMAEPEEEVKEQTEPFQRKVKAKHKKMKIRLIGKGKGKHTAGPYKSKPSYKRSKSAPPAG